MDVSRGGIANISHVQAMTFEKRLGCFRFEKGFGDFKGAGTANPDDPDPCLANGGCDGRDGIF